MIIQEPKTPHTWQICFAQLLLSLCVFLWGFKTSPLYHTSSSFKTNQKNITSSVVTNAALHVDGPFRHFLESLQTWNAPPLSTTPKTKQDPYNHCKVSKQYNIQLRPCVPIKKTIGHKFCNAIAHLLNQSHLWLRLKIIQGWLTLPHHQPVQMSTTRPWHVSSNKTALPLLQKLQTTKFHPINPSKTPHLP